MYVNQAHNDWDVYLKMVVNAYNCSIQESSGFSPFEVLFARKPTLVADVALKANDYSRQEFIHELVKRSAIIRNIVNRNLEFARERQKKYYDRLVRHSKVINVGELVLIRNFVLNFVLTVIIKLLKLNSLARSV